VLPCLSGQQFFYPFPRLVAYIVPVNAFIFFHASHFTSFPLSSPHYLSLPAAVTFGNSAFGGCTALESLALGTTIPTLGGTVFYDAGRDIEGFMVYVPTDGAKAALEAAIDDDSSDWHKALYTNIGAGKCKGVAVK
jgi:hypothetical protein